MSIKSAIIVHPDFDHVWPFVADKLHEVWKAQGDVEFIRLDYKAKEGEKEACDFLKNSSEITRLACFRCKFSEKSVAKMTTLKEITGTFDEGSIDFEKTGIRVIHHGSVEFWGQTLAEFALGLTICGLRRIPQMHHNIMSDLKDWNYTQPDGIGKPGQRGQQFGDDLNFANGTIEGKRVRVVGAGNIGSRFASFCHFLGADVAIWDPFASEPCFNRAGARRVHFMEELVKDAEIFAPMLPLTPETEGLIKKDHINALPKGCLAVVVTRAKICDCDALYKRVLADELSMAADVFDHEPLELGNSLLGRHNVIHTPHAAGRTKEANWRYAQMLADRFSPIQ